jgi:hypothetical protein
MMDSLAFAISGWILLGAVWLVSGFFACLLERWYFKCQFPTLNHHVSILTFLLGYGALIGGVKFVCSHGDRIEEKMP